MPSFNDDVQGTSATVVAGVLAAMRHLDRPFAEQRILLVGAGAAGIGIARLLREAMLEDRLDADAIARSLVLVDSHGLVHEGRDGLDPTKLDFALPVAAAAALDLALSPTPQLLDVVEAYRPTVLVGTTGIAGTFTQAVIRAVGAGCERPVIMPLSNPTANTEARPVDILAWTGGRAIVATGSPFPPVTHAGVTHEIGQANNVFVFPGIGLGAIVSEATRISDPMILAAARTLADAVTPARRATGALYPRVRELRHVSRAITLAVAREAIASGLGRSSLETIEADVDAAMWWPDYVPYRHG